MSAPRVVATISAVDLTAPVLAKVEAGMNNLRAKTAEVGANIGTSIAGGANRAAASLNEAAAASNRLLNDARALDRAITGARASINGMTGDLNRSGEQVSRLSAMFERMRGVGTVLAPVVGQAVSQGTNILAHGAVTVDSAKAKLRSAGLSKEAVDEVEQEAIKRSQNSKFVTPVDYMKSYLEARTVIQDPKDAHAASQIALDAKAALRASGDEEGAKGVDIWIKAAELAGRNKTAEELKQFVEANVRARQVMGDSIAPYHLYEGAKYTGTGTKMLSDRFLATTLPSLAQDVGGSTAGVLIRGFQDDIIAGKMKHSGLANLVEIGLFDEEHVRREKGTEKILGLTKDAEIKGRSLAQTDPDKWVHQVFLPHLAKKGITSEADITAFVQKTFDTKSGDFIIKMMQNKSGYENHARLYEEAMGFKAIQLAGENLAGALGNLKTQVENVSQSIGKSASENLTTGTNFLSDLAAGAAKSWQDFAAENPKTAGTLSTIGLGVGKVVGGFLEMLAPVMGGGAVGAGLGAGGLLWWLGKRSGEKGAAAAAAAAVAAGEAVAAGTVGAVAGQAAVKTGAAAAAGAVAAATVADAADKAPKPRRWGSRLGTLGVLGWGLYEWAGDLRDWMSLPPEEYQRRKLADSNASAEAAEALDKRLADQLPDWFKTDERGRSPVSRWLDELRKTSLEPFVRPVEMAPSTPDTPTAPAPAGYVDPGALERSLRAQDEFKRDPEAARGRAMLGRDVVEPKPAETVNVQGQADVMVSVKGVVELGPSVMTEVKRLVSVGLTRDRMGTTDNTSQGLRPVAADGSAGIGSR